MDSNQPTDNTADPDELFERLSRVLAAAGRWHELFEARLVEARHRLGLSLTDPPPLDDLPEPQRTALESDYTAACREVGGLLVEAGRLREAWQYLRPAGDKTVLQTALSHAVPSDNTIEELIELALYECIDAQRGYGWMLGHYGTCNAITTLEGLAHQLPPADLVACAATLVRHVDRELRDSAAAHIERQEGALPAPNASIIDLMAGRDWLFEHEASHVDASHLAATVRFARTVTDPAVVKLALGLTEYGGRLAEPLQYPGDPPFENLYEAHRYFFTATLGEGVEPAIDYFRKQAVACDLEQEGAAAIETLLVLLDRTGRPAEALAAYAQLVPAGARLSPYAPRMADLAQKSGEWQKYEELLRERDDLVGLAIGKLVRAQPPTQNYLN